jgi:hypothetical protein
VTNQKIATGFAALALAAALVLPSPSAQALAIRLESGATILDIADGDPGDLNPLVGAVSFVGPLAGTNWVSNLTGGLSDPVLGSTSIPNLDLASQNASSGAGTLKVYLTDTHFNSGSTLLEFLSHIGGTVNGVAGSSLVLDVFVDTNNGINFATAGPGVIQVAGPLVFGPGPFSGTDGGPVAVTGDYAVTIRVTITHTGSGVSSFDDETKVPEPATIALLGLGLLGVGFARWRAKSG